MEKNINNLTLVTTSIVKQLIKVNIYKYNKLTYLFEYLFIKNFGTRFTGELFCKLRHGPVIRDYKNQIKKLVVSEYLSADLNELFAGRQVDMNELCHINIERGRLSDEIELDPLPRNFLYKILDKYGDLNAMQLEEAVYNTKPLKIYQGLVKDGIKNKTGEEILDSNLKIKDFKNDKKVMGRLGAFNHINKYPDINIEQLKRFGKEFEFLESLRPEW